ncbi:MAG: nitrous oxide reductase family maturation protein NosD [Candidatus Odinarchaeota archaeon]
MVEMRKKYLLILSSIIFFAVIAPVFSHSLLYLGVNETFSNFKTSQLTEQNDIVIIDDLPGSFTNWTWAKDQGYCTGTGTVVDPYIISDIFFNTSTYSYNCLTIINSRKYFVIEDCLFKGSHSWAGVELDNTTNGLIQSNQLYPLTGALVWIFNSSLNEINNNNASAGFWYGIIMDGGPGLSRLNIIRDNLISFNLDIGIYLLGSSINNQILRNTIYNNSDGIVMISSANNNTIHSNMIRDNSYGIEITTDYNTIYKNCFINNGLHAIDDGVSNKWDNGLNGNYWDNYTGSDNNNDGIGDIPHNISGSAGSKDNYPLIECPLISEEAIPGYFLLIIYLTGITMTMGIIYIKLKKKINIK